MKTLKKHMIKIFSIFFVSILITLYLPSDSFSKDANVIETKVIPLTDFWEGGTFTFRSTTAQDTEKVVLELMGNNYKMKKSGSEWTASIKIGQTGEVKYLVTAYDKTGNPIIKADRIKIKPLGNGYVDNKDGTLTHKLTNKKIERYIDNGDDTITDRYAGLMMFQSPLESIKSYDDAVKEINDYNMNKYKGFTDWRLPTILEWNSGIIDKTRAEPPTLPNGNQFKNVETFSKFWSETDHRITGRKYVIDLGRGKISSSLKSKELFVWPVRAVNNID